jgi:16S rRNA C967 or C1407 C5-methylase (RsmB/RsmF family)
VNANTFIPEHFIDDVKTYLPAHLNLDDFINACRRPLRKSIRVNTLKISVAEFKHRAEKKNWQLIAFLFDHVFKIAFLMHGASKPSRKMTVIP